MNEKELERFIKIADQMMTGNESVRLNAATRCYEILSQHKMLWRDVISLASRRTDGETPEQREKRQVYSLGLSHGYHCGLYAAEPTGYEPPQPAEAYPTPELTAVFEEGVRAGFDDGFNDALRYGGYTSFSSHAHQPPDATDDEKQDLYVSRLTGFCGRIVDMQTMPNGMMVTLEGAEHRCKAIYKGTDLHEGARCVCRLVPGSPPVIGRIMAQIRPKANF